jgi:biopolymer transport protein ExbB
MQNNLSGILLSGRKEGMLEKGTRFVKAGGPVMFVLGVLPLWAIILIFIKLLQFFGKRTFARKLFSRLESYSEKNDLGGARQYLMKHQKEWTRAASACFDNTVTARQGVENIAKESISAVSARLNSHLNTLAVIAGVAPLLGLLGTVTGMIRLFEVITHYGTGDPKLLAGGISEALVTTEVGLIIAVPVLLIHNFLRNYKRAIISEIQVGTLRIINRRYPEA